MQPLGFSGAGKALCDLQTRVASLVLLLPECSRAVDLMADFFIGCCILAKGYLIGPRTGDWTSDQIDLKSSTYYVVSHWIVYGYISDMCGKLWYLSCIRYQITRWQQSVFFGQHWRIVVWRNYNFRSYWGGFRTRFYSTSKILGMVWKDRNITECGIEDR